MIRIEVITSRASFGALHDEWDDVLAASGSNAIVLAHGWLRVWADTLGRDRPLLVLRVKRRNETIGFVPLMYGQTGRPSFLSNRTVQFLGDPWEADRDFIVTRDRETVVPSILRYLSRRILCGTVALSGILESSPNLEWFQAYMVEQGDRCRVVPQSELFRVAMRGRCWEEYVQTTSRSFVRKDIARLKNRYSEHRWRVREFGAERLEEELPTLAALHQCSQMRKGRDSIYSDALYRQFLSVAARDGSFRRWIRVFVLEIDGSPAAYELGFGYDQTFHGSNAGFDPEFAKLSPSKFLMYYILESGFREGWDAYCFGPGAEDYKSHWGVRRYRRYSFHVWNEWGVSAAWNRWRKGFHALTPAPDRSEVHGVERAPLAASQGGEPQSGGDEIGVGGRDESLDW